MLHVVLDANFKTKKKLNLDSFYIPSIHHKILKNHHLYVKILCFEQIFDNC